MVYPCSSVFIGGKKILRSSVFICGFKKHRLESLCHHVQVL